MITVVSRSSRLARCQAEEVMACLPGIAWRADCIDSFGDLHQDVSLLEPVKADFFTDALDTCLVEGKADVAVHSAKDLPFPLHDMLDIVALTTCLDNTDALVSRGTVPLTMLPRGAKVGTSSPARAGHIAAIRPNLVTVGIRGSIEQRLAQLDAGSVDALIVATCALKRLGLEKRIAEILPFATHPLQGHLAVVARRDRPDMKALFHPLDVRRHWGKVWLVGCGPGDPALMTCKARRILDLADLILYDDLLDPAAIEDCPGNHVYVGKRKDHHAASQDEINEMLHQAARAGMTVVRLKGGDPLIFGRGGEEAHYLRERLVRVEIVPGVSAAQAAAAASGVPLTHRGVASAVTFHSAHAAGEGAAGMTHVVYMGASKLAEVARELAAAGLGPATPVALVRNAGMPDESRQLTTLEALPGCTAPSPLLIIAGPTAAQFHRPYRVLHTGLDPFGFNEADAVVELPLIGIKPRQAIALDLAAYDALMFTSKNAVDWFFAAHEQGAMPVIAIGPATARVITRHGGTVAHMPVQADSDGMAALLAQLPYKRVLYPCSSRSANALHAMPQVKPVVAYDTVLKTPRPVALDGYDGVVFPSSSTVDAFFAVYKNLPEHLAAWVFSKHTAERLAEHGVASSRIVIHEVVNVHLPSPPPASLSGRSGKISASGDPAVAGSPGSESGHAATSPSSPPPASLSGRSGKISASGDPAVAG